MNINDLYAIFERMDFFLLEEEGGEVYCYEPEENGPYLIASDDNGFTPSKDAPLFVACYSPQDTFLWKIENKDTNELYALYRESGGGAAFVAALAKYANKNIE